MIGFVVDKEMEQKGGRKRRSCKGEHRVEKEEVGIYSFDSLRILLSVA